MGQGFFGGGSRNGITQYADVSFGFGNFTVRRPIEGRLAKSRLSTPPTSHRSRHTQFRQVSSWDIRDGIPREIRREEVRRLIDHGVQLVEVLPANEERQGGPLCGSCNS